MCGIVGFVRDGDAKLLMRELDQCVTSIKHRGPNGNGTYVDGRIHLGHARLHVLDASTNSDQPFVSDDGRYAVTYNGEIYNQRLLRKSLEAHGFIFRTDNDTEVLLNAYRFWGDECVVKFSGMFAFCIYDREHQKLFLARDIFGEKPLYYSTEKGFSFCSELRAFETINGKLDVSLEALNHILAIGYVLNPVSLYDGVKLLPPASSLTYYIETGKIQQRQYFNYAACFEQKVRVSESEAAESVLELLRSSVADRISGPFPFGLFLSGGLDSSSLAALLAKGAYDFTAYSVGFPDRVYDESSKAETVSAKLGIPIKKLVLNNVGQADLESYFRAMDYCTSDNSAFALYRLSEFAVADVRYVLTGDGADETFGGYATYQANSLRNRIHLLIPLLRALGKDSISAFLFRNRNDRVGFNTKVSRFLDGLDADYKRSHFNWRKLFGPEERIKLLGAEHTEMIIETDPYHQFNRYYEQVPHLHPSDQHLFVDVKTWLTDNILIKTDRNTMAFGLEGRSPFLDKELVSFLAACPVGLKKDKALLRSAMRYLLPNSVVTQAKAGFNVPVLNWLGAESNKDEFKYFAQFLFNHKYSRS